MPEALGEHCAAGEYGDDGERVYICSCFYDADVIFAEADAEVVTSYCSSFEGGFVGIF